MSGKVRHFKATRPFLATTVRGGQLWLLVRQATENGYIECCSNGVFDIAYPNSELRRARVKDDGKTASALMAGEPSQCVFIEYEI